MKTTHSRAGKAALAGLVGFGLIGASLAAAAPASAAAGSVTLLNINDFHGRIDSSTIRFAGTIEQLRAPAPNDTLLLSAGDNIGASLYASASQGDEPTLDVLDALELSGSAIGNHELDQGFDDLTGRVSDRADFDYLGANVYVKGTETPALDEYEIYTTGNGIDVAVIGAVTQEVPSLVSPAGITGIDVGDPVVAVNRVVTALQALADVPDVIVAEYHEGAPAGTPEGATLEQELADTQSAFTKIVTQTSPEVDAIFTGHTHKQYAWSAPIPGDPTATRPVVQTGEYGNNIGEIKLTVDASGDIVSHTERNVAKVAPTIPSGSTSSQTAAINASFDQDLIDDYPRVAAVDSIVDASLALAATTGNVVTGSITADITTAFSGGTRDDRSSESTLGNLVADALVDKLKEPTYGSAEIGVVNPGGLRADLTYAGSPVGEGDGNVTIAEANAVLPFANNLWTTSLTGAQFKNLLEEQWQTNANGTIPSRPYLQLGLSKNVTYTYDPNAARGSHITSISVNGAPIDSSKSYRIGTFSFLLSGGDNFREFTKSTNQQDAAIVDRDAWIEYITKSSPLSPSFAKHAVAAKLPSGVIAQGSTGTVELAKLDLTSKGSPANTTVSAAFAGSTAKPVVAPVTAGAATVTFRVPYDTPANATLVVTASPSGTVVRIPVTTSIAIDSNEPKIIGENKVGSVLKARVGVWDPRPVSMSYRWYLNGKPIKKATSKTLKLTKSMIGDTITFRAVGKKAGYPTEIRYSDPVKVYRAFAKSPRPTISGTPKVGRTLTAIAHRWVPKAKHEYQWYRSGVAITGADEKKYTLTAKDKGKKITVKVWAIKKGYFTETETRSVAKIK